MAYTMSPCTRSGHPSTHKSLKSVLGHPSPAYGFITGDDPSGTHWQMPSIHRRCNPDSSGHRVSLQSMTVLHSSFTVTIGKAGGWACGGLKGTHWHVPLTHLCIPTMHPGKILQSLSVEHFCSVTWASGGTSSTGAGSDSNSASASSLAANENEPPAWTQ